MEVTRQVWWNVPAWMTVALYVGVAVALGIAAAIGWRHLRAVLKGRAAEPRRPLGAGETARRLLVEVLGHRTLLRDRYAGVMHLLLMYGFLGLFVATVLVFLHDKVHPFLVGTTYLVFKVLANLAGLAFLAGLAMAIARRTVRRTPRLERQRELEAALWLLAFITVTGFLVQGARMAATRHAFDAAGFVGHAFALAWRGAGLSADAAETLHQWLWGIHAAAVMVFFASLTVSGLRHISFGTANLLLRGAVPAGVPRSPPQPAVTASDLSWKQLLDASACVRCGRCHEACPATAAGKPLSPRRVVQQVLAQMLAGDTSEQTLLTRITPDEIWACTTCQACLEACPFDIEVADKIVDLRRALVEQGDAPAAALPVLEGMADRGSAWGQTPALRPAWARDLAVRVARPGDRAEILYWVGCAGAADPLAQQVSRAVVRCLKAAGVDFMVLGAAERCTGDPARRLGDEGLFRELAAQTIATLRAVRFERLVTHCAHCFNVFLKDYRDLGADLPVVHHSQYLAELLRAGRLRPARDGLGRVTLHDPCYLGRQNGEVAAPRAVLDALPGAERREMPRSGTSSFCCGAGGGGNWVEVRQGRRIATLRMAEAAATGAEVIATACPFCKIMLDGESGAGDAGSKPKVLDIAELLAASLDGPAPAGERAGGPG